MCAGRLVSPNFGQGVPCLALPLLNALTAHIALLDPVGTILAVNAAWTDFARANGADAPTTTGVGVNYLAVCRTTSGADASTATVVATGIAAVLAGQRDSFTYEYTCHAPHEQRWFRMRVTSLGSTVGAIVVHELITAAKQNAQTNAWLAAIVASSDDAIIGTTLAGQILSWNASAERIFGYPASQVIGQPFTRIMPPPLDVELMPLSPDDDDPRRYVEHALVRHDGQRIIVALNFAPIRDQDGMIVGSVVIGHDVTEQKKTEAALRASKERFRSIIENSVEGIVLIDANLQTCYVSPTITTLLGYPVETFAALWTHGLCHPDDQLQLDTFIATLTTNGGATGQVTTRLFHQDGNWRWVELRGNNQTHNPAIREIIVSFHNVTKRVWLYDEMFAAHRRLQQISQQLLVAQEQGRHHIARELHDEIGQALGALKINLYMLGTWPGTSANTARLAESLHIVDVLIQQVRTLSLDLHPAMLDDLGLVATLMWYLDRFQQRTGLALAFADRLGVVPMSPLVATACFRIAQEALTNVARHAQAQRMTVTLSRQEEMFALSVCDDGIGFDVQDQRAKAGAGASLGLISIAERAERAGGWVDISSSPGNGAEVWAWFPLDVASAVAN